MLLTLAINTEENSDPEVLVCPVHPDRETYLRCAECGRPICPECMVQTPVGTKCPKCAKHRGRTAGQAKPIYYARAAAAGLGTAVVGGFVLGLLRGMVPFGSIILAFLAGMALGEAVSRGARRQTGRNFQVIAGLSGIVMFFFAGYFTGFPVIGMHGIGLFFFRPDPINWVIGLLGTYMAIAKVSD